jgi:hypothetical protein
MAVASELVSAHVAEWWGEAGRISVALGLAYRCIGGRAFCFVLPSVLGHRRASVIAVRAVPGSLQVKSHQNDNRDGGLLSQSFALMQSLFENSTRSDQGELFVQVRALHRRFARPTEVWKTQICSKE